MIRKLDKIEIIDFFYLKNVTRISKIQNCWLPYFIVIDKLSDRHFTVKNQLDNQVVTHILAIYALQILKAGI